MHAADVRPCTARPNHTRVEAPPRSNNHQQISDEGRFLSLSFCELAVFSK